MRTRSERNFADPGLYVRAVSAALFVSLGLGLAQKRPAKLGTADSALSLVPQAKTRGGRHNAKADEAGSSKQPIPSMAIIPRLIYGCGESIILKDVALNIRIGQARWYARQLNQGKLSEGQKPIELDDETRLRYKEILVAFEFTSDQEKDVFEEKDYPRLASFDPYDNNSRAKPEADIVKMAHGKKNWFLDHLSRHSDNTSRTSFSTMLSTLFADNEFETLMIRQRLEDKYDFFVKRPITMVSLFRPNTFFRFVACSLPYTIDEIASCFIHRTNPSVYSIDPRTSIPEMQRIKQSPIPFTCLCGDTESVDLIEVKLGEETAICKYNYHEIPLDFVNATDMAQKLQVLKDFAMIPPTHQLLIGYCDFDNPHSTGEPHVFLCSDLDLLNDLKNESDFCESVDKFDGLTKTVTYFCAIYVDPKYSVKMRDHAIGSFKMVQDNPYLDDDMRVESHRLISSLKKKP